MLGGRGGGWGLTAMSTDVKFAVLVSGLLPFLPPVYVHHLALLKYLSLTWQCQCRLHACV